MPPERFAEGLETSDNKSFPLNFNPEKLGHEYVNEIFINKTDALVKCTFHKINKTLEELKREQENKTLKVNIVDKKGSIKEIYVSCQNCGYLCPLIHISSYKSKKCPKCKEIVIE